MKRRVRRIRGFISRQIQDICSSTLRLFHDVKSLQNSTENKTMLEYIRKVSLPHFHTILSLSLFVCTCVQPRTPQHSDLHAHMM